MKSLKDYIAWIPIFLSIGSSENDKHIREQEHVHRMSVYAKNIEKLVFYKKDGLKAFFGAPINNKENALQWVLPISIDAEERENKIVGAYEILFLNCTPKNVAEYKNIPIVFVAFSDIDLKIKNNDPKFKFIINRYTKSRGQPAMLDMSCSACNTYLMRYQKDGPGRLLRCYLDRIHHPDKLKNIQYEKFDTNKTPKLCCNSCKKLIGIPMIYKKENRPAYRLIFHSFSTKKI